MPDLPFCSMDDTHEDNVTFTSGNDRLIRCRKLIMATLYFCSVCHVTDENI